jgi:hypothetical protein
MWKEYWLDLYQCYRRRKSALFWRQMGEMRGRRYAPADRQEEFPRMHLVNSDEGGNGSFGAVSGWTTKLGISAIGAASRGSAISRAKS